MQRALTIGEYSEYLELVAHVAKPEDMGDQLVCCDW